MQDVEVHDHPNTVTPFGKPMTAYVARIVGPDEKWGVNRSFLKKKTAEGLISLPDKDGVYEVRDWPDQQQRKRYYQVLGGLSVEITEACQETDDVLEAVTASVVRQWYVVDQARVAGDVGRRPTVAVAMEALDVCSTALASGDLDLEDAEMELDKVRRVLEAMVE